MLIDLEEMQTFKRPENTQKGKIILEDLLDFINDAAPEETPGQLEKRIAKHKMLPKTDKYKRYGILLALAECGILPNPIMPPLYDQFYTQTEFFAAQKHVKGSFRSDIILPLAGWRGENGVDFKRYREIFGHI